jgi:hypothetical protein
VQGDFMSGKTILPPPPPPHVFILLRVYRKLKKLFYESKREINYGFNQYNADIIISLGIACRPAQNLKDAKLRYISSPFDWMMSYSLDTVLYLFKNKFTSFFKNISVDKTKIKPEYSHKWVNDDVNKIVSIHHFRWEEDIGDELELFRLKMQQRYRYLNFAMKISRKIIFISNRDINIKTARNFLKNIYKIYRKKITYINIINTNSRIQKEINEIKINNNLKYIEIKINDIHPDGSDKKTNNAFWLGNVDEWKNLMNKISLTRYSVIIFTLIKIMKILTNIISKKNVA